MEERLQKVLSQAGVASRRGAEGLIRSGRVRVNGQVVTKLGVKADPERDRVEVDGKLLGEAEKKIYYLFNKPAGYITTMKDPQGRPTIAGFLSSLRHRVFPVGRLDHDAEGLLILTNDGAPGGPSDGTLATTFPKPTGSRSGDGRIRTL